MPQIFSQTDNALIVKGRASPALLSGISVAGAGSQELADIGVLITGIALSHGVKIAYFTTLAESVYIYPLGNKIGKCAITGLALPICKGPGKYSTIKYVLDFYNKHKASNFKNITSPITIVIGETKIQGYLEDMQLNIGSKPETFGVGEFNLLLSVMPEASE
jgi:hypothetical protein